ncbi:hypothetical protein EN852_009720 [Mesorhizobium sp. M2E.F.Ca.ET.209.01.1.1]|uniref:hypothetical protein n=1 Tax=Mesorhizobium sp. M2E.F.Ca.ET.209.01.1.1 TaxID=2500526 RepID=UPI000FD88B9F|nr:hypothetical protein [Mesorhizobium sp. M2E.F.Ca.ET.209.01.1.1]TGS15901.1 hypothetical protein EN852_009720 [Mesorhizobium sp. M2E.F.Ca.ET.209.01.1.1]
MTQKVITRYEKSPAYRTIHVDGCTGSFTPRGQIQCAFYSERFPGPATGSFETTDGVAAWPEAVESNEGSGAHVIRETEANLVLDWRAAVPIWLWLGDVIQEVRQRNGISDDEWQSLMEAAKAAQAAERAGT